MRIFVTPRAGGICEMERQNIVRPSTESRLMTIRAGDCRVRAGKRKSRALMLRNRVRGSLPIYGCMTVFTPMRIRGCSELIIVSILVAIRTGRKSQFVNRVLARRNVALGAFNLRVLPR